MKKTSITFANEEFILDASGGLYWPAENTLLVADMHLEKGSYFVQFGTLIPPFDTLDTLLRLEKLVDGYQPKKIICLGDNIHDPNALTRIHLHDLEILKNIAGKVQEWHWLIGNHDAQSNLNSNLRNLITFSTRLLIKQITFTHDLYVDAIYQMVGHYHPKLTVNLKATTISGKCFALGSTKLFMPAFGSYTGGLDVSNSGFIKAAGKENYKYYLLYNYKIWPAYSMH